MWIYDRGRFCRVHWYCCHCRCLCQFAYNKYVGVFTDSQVKRDSCPIHCVQLGCDGLAKSVLTEILTKGTFKFDAVVNKRAFGMYAPFYKEYLGTITVRVFHCNVNIVILLQN